MTDHNRRLSDLYTDYLLVSFGATTATGLSRLVADVSHDQITRLLSQHPLTDKELWKIIKPQVRAVESPDAVRIIAVLIIAVLIIDDSVQEKPDSDESELITWHYDHSVGHTVKGVNLLSALYDSGGVSLPVAFELIQKTVLETNAKTGKDKWVCPKTKNEMAREMVASVKSKHIPFCQHRGLLPARSLSHFDSSGPLRSQSQTLSHSHDFRFWPLDTTQTTLPLPLYHILTA